MNCDHCGKEVVPDDDGEEWKHKDSNRYFCADNRRYAKVNGSDLVPVVPATTNFSTQYAYEKLMSARWYLLAVHKEDSSDLSELALSLAGVSGVEPVDYFDYLHRWTTEAIARKTLTCDHCGQRVIVAGDAGDYIHAHGFYRCPGDYDSYATVNGKDRP